MSRGRRAAPLPTDEEVDVLQVIARLIRPVPPVVDAVRPVSRPQWEGMTTREYLAVVRARNVAREAEELEIRLEMVRTEATRARIARMKRDTDDRETVRSSRWVNNTKEK